MRPKITRKRRTFAQVEAGQRVRDASFIDAQADRYEAKGQRSEAIALRTAADIVRHRLGEVG